MLFNNNENYRVLETPFLKKCLFFLNKSLSTFSLDLEWERVLNFQHTSPLEQEKGHFFVVEKDTWVVLAAKYVTLAAKIVKRDFFPYLD